jgi:hypothetical protein
MTAGKTGPLLPDLFFWLSTVNCQVVGLAG